MKKVKFLQSIAGLGDMQPEQAARKYARIERDLRSVMKKDSAGNSIQVNTEENIRATIDREKAKDALEPHRGFKQDYSFKAGDEVMIESTVADKWEAAGICTVIIEKSSGAKV